MSFTSAAEATTQAQRILDSHRGHSIKEVTISSTTEVVDGSPDGMYLIPTNPSTTHSLIVRFKDGEKREYKSIQEVDWFLTAV